MTFSESGGTAREAQEDQQEAHIAGGARVLSASNRMHETKSTFKTGCNMRPRGAGDMKRGRNDVQGVRPKDSIAPPPPCSQKSGLPAGNFLVDMCCFLPRMPVDRQTLVVEHKV